MVPGHCRNAIPRRDAETLRQAQRRRRRIEQAVTTRGGNSRSAGKPRDSPGPRGHPPRGPKAAPWDTRVSPQVCGIALRETPRGAVTGQRGEETGGGEGGGLTQLPFGSAQAGLTVGSLVQVCAPANVTTSTCFGKVRSNVGSVVVLDRILREVPITVSSVSLVTAVEIPLSGTAPKYFSFAGICDYPDGRVLLVAFPKVYSAKSLSFGLGAGQDAVTGPIELQALG